MRNIDQSNGEKAFRIFPTSVDTTLLIGWFYHGRIPNNGTAAIAQAIATSEPGHRIRGNNTPELSLFAKLRIELSRTRLSAFLYGMKYLSNEEEVHAKFRWHYYIVFEV